MSIDDTVRCVHCDHVHPATRNETRPWDWRCLKFKAPLDYGFVTNAYAPSPPYERCEKVNAFGNCRRFEPRRTPENTDVIQPRADQATGSATPEGER